MVGDMSTVRFSMPAVTLGPEAAHGSRFDVWKAMVGDMSMVRFSKPAVTLGPEAWHGSSAPAGTLALQVGAQVHRRGPVERRLRRTWQGVKFVPGSVLDLVPCRQQGKHAAGNMPDMASQRTTLPCA